MRLREVLIEDDGNALLEGVGFATVAFGLLLSSSLIIFDTQHKNLELASITRNALREYLIDGSRSLPEIVEQFQRGTSLSEQQLEVVQSCSASCRSGDQLVLEVSVEDLTARAFGIIYE